MSISLDQSNQIIEAIRLPNEELEEINERLPNGWGRILFGDLNDRVAVQSRELWSKIRREIGL